MNSGPSPWTDAISSIIRSAGATHIAIAPVTPVEQRSQELYRQWTASGCAASMHYLLRNEIIRNNPALLLHDAKSIICCAFPYLHPDSFRNRHIAAYALADDYHEVIRNRLLQAADNIRLLTGATTRVCVDTAPLRERYWAHKSGLGIIGKNGHLIIPGAGSFFFLGEILTTAVLRRSQRVLPPSCGNCAKCIEACPTGALSAFDSCVDARRCISYLTIEHRGPLPPDTDLHNRLYGCDICARVCPHNSHPEFTAIPEFTPRPEILELTPQRVADLTQAEFSTIFSHSAVKRAKLDGLRRNAAHILNTPPHPTSSESTGNT